MIYSLYYEIPYEGLRFVEEFSTKEELQQYILHASPVDYNFSYDSIRITYGMDVDVYELMHGVA